MWNNPFADPGWYLAQCYRSSHNFFFLLLRFRTQRPQFTNVYSWFPTYLREKLCLKIHDLQHPASKISPRFIATFQILSFRFFTSCLLDSSGFCTSCLLTSSDDCTSFLLVSSDACMSRLFVFSRASMFCQVSSDVSTSHLLGFMCFFILAHNLLTHLYMYILSSILLGRLKKLYSSLLMFVYTLSPCLLICLSILSHNLLRCTRYPGCQSP